ncbi:MAG TPA: hypothetical protein VKR30_05470 [Candidatus Limnocylindrales bacterium]|nr:hypothetical protein [Candidatus Limnocylindrales bacterium]
MTDDPNRPFGDEDLVDEGFGAEGEGAEDLDDAQLEAATEGARDEIEDESDDTTILGPGGVEAASVPGMTRLEPEIRHRDRGPKPARTVFAVDPALRIKDPWSAAFVIIAVAVFVAIVANAMLFGIGGAFTPIPTPSPIPTLGPTESPSEAPSGSPAASPSAGESGAPSLTPAASPGSSPAASSGSSPATSPTAAPSPAST